MQVNASMCKSLLDDDCIATHVDGIPLCITYVGAHNATTITDRIICPI